MEYKHHDIEKKWQDRWEKDGIYHAKDQDPAKKKDKFYGLIEFPYPSGEGLHVGHPRSYTAIDIMTRKQRMQGKNVLYPIGWDAFGLPTENFAIKHKIKPQDATKKNIANFTRQLKSLGFGFDWSREVDTTDPKYYKWTQWMFLQFYNSFFDEKTNRARPLSELVIPIKIKEQGDKAVVAYLDEKRLAYKASATINWCPSCKIGLANEEAQGGVCERCGGKVEKREKSQWMIRITAYAERLLKDLDSVDYLEKIKTQQKNWIGKSEGASIDFAVEGQSADKNDIEANITVFTTRVDTLFGVTYLVLSPEHAFVDRWLIDGVVKNAKKVQDYREAARKKSDIERQEDKKKTGVELKGVRALHPATGEHLPIWIADYVLSGYGTGAIMAVPAHDERDMEFAKKFKLPIIEVVSSEGVNVNSDFLNGLTTDKAKQKMTAWLKKEKRGSKSTNYKLRDWVFSRQRYWGEPIPIVHCDNCGYVPVPEKELPLELPDVKAYEPTETGESPLAAIKKWVDVKCPKCGGAAQRETDTMPNWAGSSWYFLRYCDPKNDKKFADPDKLKYWMPVDLYNGGMEHTTLHLLYSRFWYKFLFDLGHVPKECGAEPYRARRSQGLILGEGGMKMSKSKGNVINPDDVVKDYGSDIFRVYEMFIGPFEQEAPWDTKGIEGVRRFLDKVWKLFPETQNLKPETRIPEDTETLLHQTIKKVGDDIENMSFNTAVSALMILTNKFTDVGAQKVPKQALENLLKLLAPFAPHIAEELWHQIGNKESIHLSEWPKFDPKKISSPEFELVIQVNGKVRDKIVVRSDISEKEAKERAQSSEKVKGYLAGKKPKKIIYVHGRLVSIQI